MPAGRPTVVTPEILIKLEEAFALGCSDLEACFFADIGKTTLYNYQNANPEFVERKEELKKRPVLKARRRMMALMDSEDEGISHKASTDTLNRYDGKPKDKVELTGSGGKDLSWTVEIVRPKDIDGDDSTS